MTSWLLELSIGSPLLRSQAKNKDQEYGLQLFLWKIQFPIGPTISYNLRPIWPQHPPCTAATHHDQVRGAAYTSETRFAAADTPSTSPAKEADACRIMKELPQSTWKVERRRRTCQSVHGLTGARAAQSTAQHHQDEWKWWRCSHCLDECAERHGRTSVTMVAHNHVRRHSPSLIV